MWKYISLFPPAATETQASIDMRNQTFAKVMQIVKAKRDAKSKELMHDEQVIGDEVTQRKETTKIDSFFAQTPVDPNQVEKRAVMRDGRVPMMQKNIAKQ